MNLSVASDPRPLVAVTALANSPMAKQSRVRRLGRFVEDAVLLVAAVLLIPLAILVVGTPIALLARLLIELIAGI
jgi:hypothetical protein